jgi:hypothetical protein
LYKQWRLHFDVVNARIFHPYQISTTFIIIIIRRRSILFNTKGSTPHHRNGSTYTNTVLA